MKHSIFGFVGLVVSASLCLASCFPEGSGGGLGTSGAAGNQSNATAGTPDAGGTGGAAPAVCAPRPKQDGATCHPAQSAESLAGRVVDGTPQDRTVFSDQIYSGLKTNCGGCHIDNSLGNFHFTFGSMATAVDQKVISAIKSDVETCARGASGTKLDPNCFAFMPPAALQGKKWSLRDKDPADPLKPLVRLLGEWITQGRHDTFTDPAQEGATAPYAVSEELAASLTNLGTCVPDEGMVATEQSACDLDARFSALQKKPDGTLPERLGLPATLDATDLTTFDSAELAQKGVVAYVPAYPLWTDDAGKLRFVRVPVGQSIAYNRKTKQFDIPANTRFYKTFMKRVKGVDGVVRYHKVETRVIVSRPRDAAGKDQSLFGTYEWNDDETQADLVTDPQNNGEPFIDKVKTLITDEGIAEEVRALVKKKKVRNFTYEMDSRHATRRYAIPGHERCIQCHMGSPSESFILGFTPLQLNVRPCSKDTIASVGHCDAGQIEPAEGDELTQVQRLTSYGVISGYGDAELAKLEDPQGTKRAPRPKRSTEELVAQGYMLGNCAHCHNPNGYPSVEHPELKPLLNFLPSEEGGIYGFPLERYSPRIYRNVTSDGPIPYITPSLRDRFADSNHGWTPKLVKNPDQEGYSFIEAPWRSLIYRNVDTPFTYTDDSAIYPHMPLNSPGFDCRAPRILGEWMVSIPALAKHPELSEDVNFPTGATPPELTELDPQPYREVKEGDAEFGNGQAQAARRLQAFRAGLRDKNYCPDTSDIVDLTVLRSNNKVLIPADGEVPGMPRESVPDRPHWVSVDLTNPPGPWNPRRADWKQIIVDQDFTDAEAAIHSVADQQDLVSQKTVVKLLHDITLTKEFRDFATTEVPFGLWKQKPTCKFDKVPKVGQFDGKQRPRPRWMDVGLAAPDSPVYSAIPGALVFNMICVNCHGQDADSSGRQAQTLAEMTGGTARVANFRDGLFGPFGQMGANRKAIFGSDDVAARYLPWMALGGTKARIPRPILNLVANTPVAGVSRRGVDVNTANMLQTAQALCTAVAAMQTGTFDPASLKKAGDQAALHGGTGLISENGDAELWTRLCTFNNPPPVHGLTVVKTDNGYNMQFYKYYVYYNAKYPAGQAVGDGTGKVQPSLTADNTTPWCVIPPASTALEALAWLDAQRAADGSKLPVCPPQYATPANQYPDDEVVDGAVVRGYLDEWAARGAINAGQAVFLYLDQMISQGKGRVPRYDECELLGN